MASSVKACTNSRYRKTNIVIITILSLLSCFALVMVIYNLIKGSYLFFDCVVYRYGIGVNICSYKN